MYIRNKCVYKIFFLLFIDTSKNDWFIKAFEAMKFFFFKFLGLRYIK